MNSSPRTFLIAILMIGLAAVPMIADNIDEPFYTVMFSRMPVSYTHLTLPTIYSV